MPSPRANPNGTPAFGLEPLEGRTLMAAGTGLAGAYFARTNLTLARFSRADALIDLSWPSGTPNATLGTDGFSVRWTGQVLAKFSETHTFTVTSAGGVRLWVNNFLIIDAWPNHALREDSGSLRLTGGKLFNIQLEYWSDGVAPEVDLDWQSARMARNSVPTDRLFPSTLDTVAPTAPGRLRASSATSTSIKLVWDPASDPSGVAAYDVYVGSTKVASTLPGQLSYTRNNLAPNTGYVFSVQAMDAAGNTSSLATTAVTTAAPSNLPPSAPINLQVTNFGPSSVSLQWSPSVDDLGVASYRIYRNGVKLPAAPTGTSFTDNTAQPNTAYTYAVRAADGGGLFSGYSAPVNVTTASGASHNAYTGIDAVDFDSSSGVTASGGVLTSLGNTDWVRYANVNFGAGANSVAFDLALDPSNRGGTIELRLGAANGTLIGRHFVPPTGSSTTFRIQKTNVANVSGTHDLFLVFRDRSDVARLREITFSTVHLTKIMPLGDSITEGNKNLLESPTYRYYLWKMLANAGFDVDFIGSRTQASDGANPLNYDVDLHHEGYSGWRADQIAANAAGWAATQQPEIVILHIGTNDLMQGQSVTSTVNDIEDIIENLRSSVPNVTILLAKILPLVGHLNDVDLLNDRIADLVAEHNTAQSPLILVDLNTGFTLDDMADGIHAKPETENEMANRIYATLSSLLQ